MHKTYGVGLKLSSVILDIFYLLYSDGEGEGLPFCWINLGPDIHLGQLYDGNPVIDYVR